MTPAIRLLIQGFILPAMLAMLLSPPVFSQSRPGRGYYVWEKYQLPDTLITAAPKDIPEATHWLSARIMGMGKTRIVNGRWHDAQQGNPALLTQKSTNFITLGTQVSASNRTIDAAKFIADNEAQFVDGHFIKVIESGYANYQKAATLPEKAAAIREIRSGLIFINELMEKTVGDRNTPYQHGMDLVFDLQHKQQKWGISLYSNTRAGFTVVPSQPMKDLMNANISENHPELSPEEQLKLLKIVAAAIDSTGQIHPAALPSINSFAYTDIIANLGYAFSVNSNLDLGSSLKIINRRFFFKNINYSNLDQIISDIQDDFESSITTATFDVGMLYHHSNGTKIGLALQNIIPMTSRTSDLHINSLNYQSAYVLDNQGNPRVGFVDANGNFTPDVRGDTLISLSRQQQTERIPNRLITPFLANAGILYPLNPDWDITVDWVDILAQDDAHQDKTYLARLRMGTEMRLLNNLLALRAGFGDAHLSVGSGLSLKFLQLDMAYAYHNFTETHSYIAQLRLNL